MANKLVRNWDQTAAANVRNGSIPTFSPSQAELSNSLNRALAYQIYMKLVAGDQLRGHEDIQSATEYNQQVEIEHELYKKHVLPKLLVQAKEVEGADLQSLFSTENSIGKVDAKKVETIAALKKMSLHEAQNRIGHAIRLIAAERLGKKSLPEYQNQRDAFFDLVKEQLSELIKGQKGEIVEYTEENPEANFAMNAKFSLDPKKDKVPLIQAVVNIINGGEEKYKVEGNNAQEKLSAVKQWWDEQGYDEYIEELKSKPEVNFGPEAAQAFARAVGLSVNYGTYCIEKLPQAMQVVETASVSSVSLHVDSKKRSKPAQEQLEWLSEVDSNLIDKFVEQHKEASSCLVGDDDIYQNAELYITHDSNVLEILSRVTSVFKGLGSIDGGQCKNIKEDLFRDHDNSCLAFLLAQLEGIGLNEALFETINKGLDKNNDEPEEREGIKLLEACYQVGSNFEKIESYFNKAKSEKDYSEVEKTVEKYKAEIAKVKFLLDELVSNEGLADLVKEKFNIQEGEATEFLKNYLATLTKYANKKSDAYVIDRATGVSTFLKLWVKKNNLALGSRSVKPVGSFVKYSKQYSGNKALLMVMAEILKACHNQDEYDYMISLQTKNDILQFANLVLADLAKKPQASVMELLSDMQSCEAYIRKVGKNNALRENSIYTRNRADDAEKVMVDVFRGKEPVNTTYSDDHNQVEVTSKDDKGREVKFTSNKEDQVDSWSITVSKAKIAEGFMLLLEGEKKFREKNGLDMDCVVVKSISPPEQKTMFMQMADKVFGKRVVMFENEAQEQATVSTDFGRPSPG